MAEYVDTISRQAAIEATKRIPDLTVYAFCSFIDMLSNLPPVQPEIVRCKDCVHYDLAINGYNGNCNRQYATFYADDFCSYGERRGDAE